MSLSRAVRKNSLLRKIKRKFKRKKVNSQHKISTKSIYISQDSLYKYGKLVPVAGYFLLTLTFIDYLALLIPTGFFNPNWELNVIGQFIESAWAPILGFLLVFLRLPEQKIQTNELRLLSFVSWLLLLTSICYFLCVPLIISNTVRINRLNFAQLTAQTRQQEAQVTEIQNQLVSLSNREITNIFGSSPIISSTDSSNTMRQKLLGQLKQEQTQSLSKARLNYQQQKNNLIENALRWIIGAVLTGIFLIMIRRNTKWTKLKTG